MALYATNRFAGDGSTTSYEFSFVGKYIDRTHVKVYQEDNATKVRTYVSINDSNFLNDTTLRGLPVTPVGQTLVIYRDTPKPPIVDFVNGSRFTEYNMDLVARQGLFVAMEAMDAGDIDAREQLLAAIAVVTGLVDDATAAVSDATAAALAAATSATNALGSAQAAMTAQTGAETARNAAQASAGNAATSATNAANSASAAASSAAAAATSKSDAAASASTATTQAGLASGYSVSANNSANNAATSATNASGYASTASTKAGEAATSAANAANSATQAQTYANSINASTFVTLAGTQTVSGAKTFSIAPEVGNVSDPNLAPGKALNWASVKPRTIINGWGTQAGVTSNLVYMGWSGSTGGIKAQVDASPMGSVLTTAAAGNQYMIGCLAFAHYRVDATKTFGDQVYGSDLVVTSSGNAVGGALSGTWVCLGHCQGSATNMGWTVAKTLWMRVA